MICFLLQIPNSSIILSIVVNQRPSRKETKLAEQTAEQTVLTPTDADVAPQSRSENGTPVSDPTHLATVSDIRRERRARRRAEAQRDEVFDSEVVAGEGVAADAGLGEVLPAATLNVADQAAQGSRKAKGPRAPKAGKERGAGRAKAKGTADVSDEQGEALPDDVAAAITATVGGSAKKGTRTADRARKKQAAATAAVQSVDQNHSLGALNRHLNMMMQQLTMSHRVIGRIAAERDALRQQLADLQGIPVDQIHVTTVAGATEEAPRASAPRKMQPSEPEEPSRFARYNFLGGEDIALVRKRRQMFVLTLLIVGAILYVIAQQKHWQISGDISKNGLSALPYVGQLMSVFLAGWLMFRVIRISSKGLMWVFPSDKKTRRRR
ncbi:MAG: hypothetical protein U0031_21160 [Thermomicrobiales bacterium]